MLQKFGETEGLSTLGRMSHVSGWLYSRPCHLVESAYYFLFASSGGSSLLLGADVCRSGCGRRVVQGAWPGPRPSDFLRNYTKGVKRTSVYFCGWTKLFSCFDPSVYR